MDRFTENSPNVIRPGQIQIQQRASTLQQQQSSQQQQQQPQQSNIVMFLGINSKGFMPDFTSTQQQQQQLDMSEFPALGSGSTRMMEFSASGAGSNGNNQQHPSSLYQQRAWNSSGGPSGTTFSAVIGGLSNSGASGVAVNDFGRPPMQEDFPALGTLPNQQQRISQQQQHRIGSLRGHSSSTNVSAPGDSGNAGVIGDVSQNLSAMGTLQGNFASTQGNLPTSDQQGPPGSVTSPGSYSTAGAKMSPNGNAPASQNAANLDRFGLMGLLGVIRMTDQDLNTLALGCDLTTLGLNLSSTEPLHSTFLSPWPEQPSTIEMSNPPQLPECYAVPQLPLPKTKIPYFSDETLFYIFYALPLTELQMLSSDELYKRGWRFHKELKCWLMKELNAPDVIYTPTESGDGEKGVYIFWDIMHWCRITKDFVVYYDMLEEKNITAQGTPGSVSPVNATPKPIGTPQQTPMVKSQWSSVAR